MSDGHFNLIIDAGAELFDELRSIMERYGLETDDAPAVISVATAGVLKVSPVPVARFVAGFEIADQMWTSTGENGTLGSLKFMPPHRTIEHERTGTES